MLIRAYLPQIITALFGGLFVALGIVTFGDAKIFDLLYFGILVFTSIICRKNINVLGVISIIAIHQILSEAAWFTFNNGDLLSPLTAAIFFYSIIIFACFKFRHDNISKFLIVSLLFTVATEAYLFIKTGSIAALHWYLVVLTINLLTRHLIFLRVSYTGIYYPNKAKSINLDWQIYKLNALAIIVQTANVTEYSLRKVFGLNDILYVYNLYPYLMQAISTYSIFIIFHESYKLIIPKMLKA